MKLSKKVKDYIKAVQKKVTSCMYPVAQISRDTQLSRYKIENLTSLSDAEKVEDYINKEDQHRRNYQK